MNVGVQCTGVSNECRAAQCWHLVVLNDLGGSLHRAWGELIRLVPQHREQLVLPVALAHVLDGLPYLEAPDAQRLTQRPTHVGVQTRRGWGEEGGGAFFLCMCFMPNMSRSGWLSSERSEACGGRALVIEA